jgi:hypothetical protein
MAKVYSRAVAQLGGGAPAINLFIIRFLGLKNCGGLVLMVYLCYTGVKSAHISVL